MGDIEVRRLGRECERDCTPNPHFNSEGPQLKMNPQLNDILLEIQRRSSNHQIGGLQTLRAEIRGVPVRATRLFGKVHSGAITDYAFHWGGRSELQFNIGLESEGRDFRHGVAFSFEPGRGNPWPTLSKVLEPKVKWFNQFIARNLEKFRDMRMWCFSCNKRLGTDETPGPISGDRLAKGMFIFLGKRQFVHEIDYDVIMADLDRLLPLYRYVETGGAAELTAPPTRIPFQLCPRAWVDRVEDALEPRSGVGITGRAPAQSIAERTS